RDVLGAPAVGEQAVMPDTVETVGQYVDQEAADELIGAERHKFVASVALGPVILPFEGHALAVESDEAAVGNSKWVRRETGRRAQRRVRRKAAWHRLPTRPCAVRQRGL